jgi:hypothetical protein
VTTQANVSGRTRVGSGETAAGAGFLVAAGEGSGDAEGNVDAAGNVDAEGNGVDADATGKDAGKAGPGDVGGSTAAQPVRVATSTAATSPRNRPRIFSPGISDTALERGRRHRSGHPSRRHRRKDVSRRGVLRRERQIGRAAGERHRFGRHEGRHSSARSFRRGAPSHDSQAVTSVGHRTCSDARGTCGGAGIGVVHAECRGTNVHVTVVFPGAVATNITTNSGVDIPVSPEMAAQAARRTLSADKAARLIIDGMERNAYRVLVGNDPGLMDALYRINPSGAASFIGRQMKDLLKS